MAQEDAYDLKQQARALCCAPAGPSESSWLTASTASRHEVSIHEMLTTSASVHVTSSNAWTQSGEVRHIACRPVLEPIKTVSAVVRRAGAWDMAIWRCTPEADCMEVGAKPLGSPMQQTSWSNTDPNLLLGIAESSTRICSLGEDSIEEKASSTLNQTGTLSCGCFQPGTTTVTVVGGSTSWYLWDSRTGDKHQTNTTPHQLPIQDLSMCTSSPHLLATGARDGHICLWDLRRGIESEPLLNIAAHSHWVWTVDFNPQYHQLLASASSDGTACLWHLPSLDTAPSSAPSRSIAEYNGEATGTVKHSESVYCASWSTSEPWKWSSLSFDGHMVVSKVPAASVNMLKL